MLKDNKENNGFYQKKLFKKRKKEKQSSYFYQYFFCNQFFPIYQIHFNSSHPKNIMPLNNVSK